MEELPLGYMLTPHAREELARRGIELGLVAAVVRAPEQRVQVRAGREVLQSRVMVDGKAYVVRVFVDTDRSPLEIVTVYRSSKVGKYWRSTS